MKNVPQESVVVNKPSRSPVFFVLSGIMICAIAGFCFLGYKVFQAREVLGFALQKPAIIKAVMEQYNRKQAAIDQEFLKEKQTAEDKLLNAITEQIKK